MKDDPAAFADGMGLLLRVDSEGKGPACVTVGVMLRKDLNPTYMPYPIVTHMEHENGTPAQQRPTYLRNYLPDLLEF